MSEEPEVEAETEESRKDNVQVCVRCRPMSETEIGANYKNIITVDHIGGTVTVNSPSPSEPPKVNCCHRLIYACEWPSPPNERRTYLTSRVRLHSRVSHSILYSVRIRSKSMFTTERLGPSLTMSCKVGTLGLQ